MEALPAQEHITALVHELEQHYQNDMECDATFLPCPSAAKWVGAADSCECFGPLFYCNPHHDEWVALSGDGFETECSYCGAVGRTVFTRL